MDKLKAGLLAGVGTIVGVLTLKRMRTRRSTPREEAATAADAAVEEAQAAADHAAAAARHARTASESAAEYARDEIEQTTPSRW